MRLTVEELNEYRSQERPRHGGVYFVQAADETGLIKIGYSSSGPGGRLKDLQCGSPVELKLIGWIPAPRTLEGRLHAHLSKYRVRGEWFEPNDELSWLMACGYASENLPVALARQEQESRDLAKEAMLRRRGY